MLESGSLLGLFILEQLVNSSWNHKYLVECFLLENLVYIEIFH